jgi:predicted DNA-binding antitoxin AbrB/MazE fold protein
METTFEAIYENGVLKPLDAAFSRSQLTEGETVFVSVQRAPNASEQIAPAPSARRLPDPPLEDESIVAPCDLPRNPSKSVPTIKTEIRLPDGIGF